MQNLIKYSITFFLCLIALLNLGAANNNKIYTPVDSTFYSNLNILENIAQLIEVGDIEQSKQLFETFFISWHNSFNRVDDFVSVGNRNFYPFANYRNQYDTAFTKIYHAAIIINEDTKYDKNIISKILFLAGRSKFYVRSFRDSYKYLGKSNSKLVTHNKQDSILMLRNYEAIADVFEEIREYEVALSYYSICYSLNEAIYDKNNKQLARVYEDMGSCFAHLNDEASASKYWGVEILETSIDYLELAHITNLSIHDSIAAAVNTFQLGLLNMYLGLQTNNNIMSSRVDSLLNEAIYFLEENDPYNPKLGNCYNVFKQVYVDSKQYDSAIFFTKKAYKLHLKNRGKYHPMSIMAVYNLANQYNNYNSNYDSALFYSQKCVEFSFPGYSFDSMYCIPNLNYPADFMFGFAALEGKALNLIRIGIKTNDSMAINHAFEIISKTSVYLSKNEAPNFGLGYFSANSSYSKMLKTGGACYMLCHEAYPNDGYDKLAFQYYEKLKYLQFIANMNEEKLMVEAGIPGNVVELNRNLKNRKRELKGAFVDNFLSANHNDLELTINIQDSYLEITDSLHDIKEYCIANFPKYFQLLNAEQSFSLSDIQNSMDTNTAVINYFNDNKYIYSYVILNNDIKLFQVPVSSEFLLNIDSIYQNILLGINNQTDKKLFAEFSYYAQYFYKKLFPPALVEYISGKNRLVLIPEEKMYNIPFDVLLLKQPKLEVVNYANLDYLVKHYSITISFSMRMLLNENNPFAVFDYVYEGFAPKFDEKQLTLLDNENIHPFSGMRSFGELTSNIDEVKEVSVFFDNSKLFVGSMANEKEYKKYAPHTQIVHLPTHAQANVKNPLLSKIIFSFDDKGNNNEDNILYMHEIYNNPVNAQLVVLSTCESNKSNVNTSEGVISLSRAFLNGGAKSVISTNWWAHDQTTKDIMVDFFRGVKNQEPFDIALQKAKLNYLKNSDPQFAHPFYWANFVLTGSNNPIIVKAKQPTANYFLWFAISILIMISVVIVFKIKPHRML